MEKAIAVARKAARSAEDDWITLWAAGNLLSENGNMQEAEQLYVAAAARLRHNHVVRVQLGNHLLKTGRIDEAIGHFKDAIRFAPEYMEAHFGLAKAYSLQGKNAEARAIYEERLRKGPNRFLALTELVVFLSQTGKLKEAEERTREVLKMVPDDIEVLGFLGDLEMKQHRVTEAIEHYEAAMRIWPDWPGLREKLEEARKESDLRKKNGRTQRPSKRETVEEWIMAGTFLNYNEAADYCNQIADPVTRRLTSFVFTTLTLEGLRDNYPNSDFDVLYFIKIVELTMSRHQTLTRMLNGEVIE